MKKLKSLLMGTLVAAGLLFPGGSGGLELVDNSIETMLKRYGHINTISLEYLQTPKIEGNFIMIDESIQFGDDIYLKLLMNDNRGNIDGFYLNSDGGVLDTSINIAEIIHNSKLPVYIPENGICLSGCALLYLAGKEKYAYNNSQLGLHQAYLTTPNDDYIIPLDKNSVMAYYIGKYGGDVKLVYLFTHTSPSNMFISTPKDLVDSTIVLDN